MKRGIGLAALICGFFGSGASAEVVRETLTFTDEQGRFFLPFTGFDSGLGALKSIEASLTGIASIAEGEITGLTDDEGGVCSLTSAFNDL